MTLTTWLVFIIAVLLCALIWQRHQLLRWQHQQRQLITELRQIEHELEQAHQFIADHTLAGEQYDPEKDPTRQPHHEHAIAEALVELTDDDTIDEPAPLLDEQRPDTAPTRVPTPEELAAASRGALLDKRPATGHVPVQDKHLVEPYVPEFIEERQP
jgi:hypothetical protein